MVPGWSAYSTGPVVPKWFQKLIYIQNDMWLCAISCIRDFFYIIHTRCDGKVSLHKLYYMMKAMVGKTLKDTFAMKLSESLTKNLRISENLWACEGSKYSLTNKPSWLSWLLDVCLRHHIQQNFSAKAKLLSNSTLGSNNAITRRRAVSSTFTNNYRKRLFVVHLSLMINIRGGKRVNAWNWK